MILCTCVCVPACMSASLHAHGTSQFTLSSMWALELELGFSHLLSHLTSLALCTFEIVPQTLKNEHLTKSERWWGHILEDGNWALETSAYRQTEQSQIPLQNTESD